MSIQYFLGKTVHLQCRVLRTHHLGERRRDND